MNRSEGLVQRRNIAQASGGAGAKDDSDEEKTRRKQAHESEEDDDDGKNTRLTLMEECLLLGLKDKEVCTSHHLPSF